MYLVCTSTNGLYEARVVCITLPEAIETKNDYERQSISAIIIGVDPKMVQRAEMYRIRYSGVV